MEFSEFCRKLASEFSTSPQELADIVQTSPIILLEIIRNYQHFHYCTPSSVLEFKKIFSRLLPYIDCNQYAFGGYLFHHIFEARFYEEALIIVGDPRYYINNNWNKNALEFVLERVKLPIYFPPIGWLDRFSNCVLARGIYVSPKTFRRVLQIFDLEYQQELVIKFFNQTNFEKPFHMSAPGLIYEMISRKMGTKMIQKVFESIKPVTCFEDVSDQKQKLLEYANICTQKTCLILVESILEEAIRTSNEPDQNWAQEVILILIENGQSWESLDFRYQSKIKQKYLNRLESRIRILFEIRCDCDFRISEAILIATAQLIGYY